MRKNRIFYILMLILFFWIMIMYNSWQTELIFKVGVIIPIIIGAVNFFMAGKIKVYFDEREEYCQKEDSIKKYIMIDNGTIFPAARIELKVEIEDYFGHIEKRTILINSEPHTIRNFGMDMTFHHYGIMAVRIKQIHIYDFFFLTVYKKKLNIETMIYIFPDLTKKMEFFIKSRKYGIEEDSSFSSSSIQLPEQGDISPMRGKNNQFRVRIGTYRAVYNLDKGVLTVTVIKVNNRGDIYK